MSVVTRESGSATILESELITMPWYISSEQMILSSLKDKGAPIDGVLYFRWKKDYERTFTKNPMTGDLDVSWRKLK